MPDDRLRWALNRNALQLDKIRRTQEAKTWKDLAQAAYKKQLASKEKAK